MDRAAKRRRPGRARARARLAAREVKAIVTRPRAQAKPLVEALERAGHRSGRVPADRDRAHLRRAGRRRGLRLADRHEPERRRRDRAARPQPAAHRRRRARHRRGAARARDRAGVRPARVVAGGLLREFPRPAGRVLFAAAEGARRRPIDGARRRLRSALPHAAAPAGAAGGRRRRPRLRLRGPRLRGYRRLGARGRRSGRRRRGSRARSGSRSRPRRRRTISTASSPRCAM